MSERTLKEQALLERIADLTVKYEDQDADRRVEITELVQRLNQLENENQMMKQIVESKSQPAVNLDVIEGEVVEEEGSADESS